MDWELLLLMSPIAVFLWWAGFFATNRMRIGKNQEREELAKRLLAKKAAREAAESADQTTAPEAEVEKQEAS